MFYCSFSLPRAAAVQSSDDDMLLTAARAGLGVIGVVSLVAKPLVDAGSLVRLLPEWEIETWTMYAAVHSRRHLPAAVRALLDFLRASLGIGTRGPSPSQPREAGRAEPARSSPWSRIKRKRIGTVKATARLSPAKPAFR